VVADIHLYCADTGAIGANGSRELLADDELARLAELTHERRRIEYLTGRALLRLALQSYTGRPAEWHRFRIGHNGKPECVDGPAFSLSHSGHLVACAISPAGQIGVDVEFPRPRLRAVEIASRYFSRHESEWLRGQPSDRFYMLWVLKEAYLKATGLGIAGGLDTLECSVEPPAIESRTAGVAEEPTLALYGVGPAFLGVATTGYRFSVAQADYFRSNAGMPPPEIRLIARSS
jgi:4'-phosphopantetheinyl transferase